MDIGQDEFEVWLVIMDEELEAFLAVDLPVDVARCLDYTPASLLPLERFILDRFPDMLATEDDAASLLLDRLGRYIGETIRRQIGCSWSIDLVHEDSANYMIPVLATKNDGVEITCPITLATAAVDRRTGDYIYGVACYLIDRFAR